eukprot:g32528.t1
MVTGKLPLTASSLIVPQPCTAHFHLLPKIHKQDCLRRPIVSACTCPTELISSYLNSVFCHLVQSLPTYIRDSSDALCQFQNFQLALRGVPMSTYMSPSYVCLVVGYVEHSLFQSYSSRHPQLFLQNIGDIISVASLSHLELEKLINFASNFHPTLIFTCNRVPFVFYYHPTSIHIQRIISCYLCHLQLNATTRHIFPSSPLPAFCKDLFPPGHPDPLLLHSKQHPNPPPQPYSNFPCNRTRRNTCLFTSSFITIQGPKHTVQ